MCEVFAPLQLRFAELHCLEKPRLFFQIAANRFPRQRIRVLSSVAGESCQFGGLLGVEMYFHGLRLGAAATLVKLRSIVQLPICFTEVIEIEGVNSIALE
jgi:hypothetical protein